MNNVHPAASDKWQAEVSVDVVYLRQGLWAGTTNGYSARCKASETVRCVKLPAGGGGDDDDGNDGGRWRLACLSVCAGVLEEEMGWSTVPSTKQW
ncbi:hypothetical protein ColTof3_03790 [Colletotrichum tofieldiae]|nr:hypothetical protein ColTof3_03790 [Colletotrichum tofieldiae]